MAVMGDGRGFTVHHFSRPHDRRTKGLRHRLVSKTDAEHGKASGIMADHRQGDARVIRRTGPRRDHDFLRIQRVNLRQRQRVISPDQDISAQFAEILIKVPGKRL